MDITLGIQIAVVAVYFLVQVAISGRFVAVDRALLLAVGIAFGGWRVTATKVPEVTLEQFSKIAARELGFNHPRESGSKNRAR